MTALQTVDATVHPEVQQNDNFETLSIWGIFGKRQPVTSGLTWGYYGGIFNGNTVADGTVSLTDSTANYVVVNRGTGVVSVSTATTNWTSASYARLYKVTASGGAVTAVEDHRADTNGLLLRPGWLVKTTGYTAIAGDRILCDSSGGAFSITMPASPAAGDEVRIKGGASAATNAVTVARNGNTIMGLASDMTVSTNNEDITFVYSGTTWSI